MSQEELQDSFQHVRKHGDVLDANSSLKSRRGLEIFAVMQGLAMIPAAIDTDIKMPYEYAVTYPAYFIGASVVAGAVNGGRKLAEHRRVRQSEETQQALRSQLDEPVDVFRVGKRKDRHLLMRWYATDDLEEGETDTYGLGSRLQRLADAAEKHDVGHIVLGVDFLSQETLADTERYGFEQMGKYYVSGVKKRRSVEVIDNVSDDRVQVVDTEQARALSELLKSQGQQSLIVSLLEKLGNGQLLGQYQAMDGNSELRTQFLARLRAQLNMAVDDDTISNRKLIWNNPTNPEFSRTATTHLISPGPDGRVTQITTTLSENSAQSHREFEGTTTLLSLSGAANLDDLIENLQESHSTKPDTKGLLTAVYLLMARDMDPEDNGNGSVVMKARTNLDETLFHRLATTDRPRTTPALRKGRTETVGFMHRRGRLARLAGSVLVVGMALGAGYEGGKQLENAYVRAYFQEMKDYAAAHHLEGDQAKSVNTLSDQYKEWIRTHRTTWQRYIKSTFEALENAQGYTSQKTADVYRAVLGERFLDLISQVQGQFQHDEFNYREDIDEPYSPGHGGEDIGDAFVSPDSPPIYTINSLSGKSSDGYWFEQTNPIMYISQSSGFGPSTFRDYDMSYASDPTSEGNQVRQLHLPSSTDEITAEKPDFMVEAKLPSYPSTRSLPVLEGNEIVGMQVIDEAHPGSSAIPHVQYDSRDGSYQVSFDTNAVANMKDPRMRYWLKQTANDKPVNHYVEPVTYPGIDSELPSDPNETARIVKQTLGLPEHATDEQVFAAIQKKGYSFHPFADANLIGLTVGDGGEKENDRVILDNIGRDIAQLHALNCNLAQTTLILATKGVFNGKKINPVVGFHGGGDGTLRQADSHAWIVREDGELIDPTPSGSLPNQPKPESSSRKSSHDLTQDVLWEGAALVALLATGVGLYRTRRQLYGLSDNMRTKYATSGEHAASAVSTLENILYGPKNSSITLHFKEEKEDDTADRFTRNMPEDRITSGALSRYMKTQGRTGYEELPLATRAAMRRLNRHQPAIRRHMARRRAPARKK